MAYSTFVLFSTSQCCSSVSSQWRGEWLLGHQCCPCPSYLPLGHSLWVAVWSNPDSCSSCRTAPANTILVLPPILPPLHIPIHPSADVLMCGSLRHICWIVDVLLENLGEDKKEPSYSAVMLTPLLSSVCCFL